LRGGVQTLRKVDVGFAQFLREMALADAETVD
jgi:hypothetical protein